MSGSHNRSVMHRQNKPVPSASPAPDTLRPHADTGPLALDQAQVNELYPIVPQGVGRVFMPHPQRLQPPTKDFIFWPAHGNKFPQLRSGLYCLHCFKPTWQGRKCNSPCDENCGCCGQAHDYQFCINAYASLLSIHRRGGIPDPIVLPPVGFFMPTDSQFRVLQANGFIKAGDQFNPLVLPRFTNKYPLLTSQGDMVPFQYQGPPPPPRPAGAAPCVQAQGYGGHGSMSMQNQNYGRPAGGYGSMGMQNQNVGGYNERSTPYYPTSAGYGQPPFALRAPSKPSSEHDGSGWTTVGYDVDSGLPMLKRQSAFSGSNANGRHPTRQDNSNPDRQPRGRHQIQGRTDGGSVEKSRRQPAFSLQDRFSRGP